MESLTDTLYALLYDRNFRRDFETQGVKDQNDFSTVDWKQLHRFGDSIERKIFEDPLVANRSLTETFTQTLAQLREDRAALRRAFLISPEFARYSDLNHARAFLGLEEAFYLFLREAHPALEPSARHDFLTAHLQILAGHQNPAFHLNTELIQRLENGYASVQFAPAVWLYACVEQKLISGPVDLATARLFTKYFIEGSALDPADAELVQGFREMGFRLAKS